MINRVKISIPYHHLSISILIPYEPNIYFHIILTAGATVYDLYRLLWFNKVRMFSLERIFIFEGLFLIVKKTGFYTL